MLHGIAAPELYRSDGGWQWNNYQGRCHAMHVDLMDVLSGYGASRFVGLDLTAPYIHLLAGEGKRKKQDEGRHHSHPDSPRMENRSIPHLPTFCNKPSSRMNASISSTVRGNPAERFS